MRLPFWKRTQRAEEAQIPSVPSPVSDDSIPHILVRIGKLSPFVLGALISGSARSLDDEEVVRLLIEKKIVERADVDAARSVQAKLRSGQPVYEEWAKMEAVLEEGRRCAEELSAVISERKNRRRQRGEDTVMFVTPKRMRSAT